MPKFRVSGVFRRDFVVEVEAENEDDACDLVGQFSLNDFDATSYVESSIDDCIELDDDGNEVERCHVCDEPFGSNKLCGCEVEERMDRDQ